MSRRPRGAWASSSAMDRYRLPQPTGTYPTREHAAAEITAGTVAAAAATSAGIAGYSGSVAALVVAIVGFVAATYELLAIYTDDFPTITEAVKAGGWWERGIFVAATTLLIFDHFVTGWVA